VPFQPGGRAALAPSQQHVLAALHRWPGLTSSALAPALGLSPSTIGKMRADFRRSGLWAPWFDLDLRALGVDSVAVLGGLFAGPRAPRPSEAALSQVLAANRIPGVGVLGDGHLLLIALPRTLAATAALEAALLEISPRGSGHPWLARLEVAWFPVQDTAFIDYSRVIPDPAAAKSKGRALRLLVETGPNVLAGPPRPSHLRRFAANFVHLFALLLWGGALLALLGGMPQLSVAIVVVVLVNARNREVRITVAGFDVGGTRDLLTDRTQQGDAVTLPAYGAMVLERPRS